jgi:hypothetical protein
MQSAGSGNPPNGQEISRFSCMLFLSVCGFLDYAGLTVHSRLAWLSYCLPPHRNGVGILFQTGFSKLNSPAHRYPCLRFKRHLAISPARLQARMDSLLSFPVGLFHPPPTCRFIPALSGWPVNNALPPCPALIGICAAREGLVRGPHSLSKRGRTR